MDEDNPFASFLVLPEQKNNSENKSESIDNPFLSFLGAPSSEHNHGHMNSSEQAIVTNTETVDKPLALDTEKDVQEDNPFLSFLKTEQNEKPFSPISNDSTQDNNEVLKSLTSSLMDEVTSQSGKEFTRDEIASILEDAHYITSVVSNVVFDKVSKELNIEEGRNMHVNATYESEDQILSSDNERRQLLLAKYCENLGLKDYFEMIIANRPKLYSHENHLQNESQIDSDDESDIHSNVLKPIRVTSNSTSQIKSALPNFSNPSLKLDLFLCILEYLLRTKALNEQTLGTSSYDLQLNSVRNKSLSLQDLCKKLFETHKAEAIFDDAQGRQIQERLLRLLANLYSINLSELILAKMPEFTPDIPATYGSSSSLALDLARSSPFGCSKSEHGITSQKSNMLIDVSNDLIIHASKYIDKSVCKSNENIAILAKEMKLLNIKKENKALESVFLFNDPSPDDLAISRIRKEAKLLGSGSKSLWLPGKDGESGGTSLQRQSSLDKIARRASKAVQKMQSKSAKAINDRISELQQEFLKHNREEKSLSNSPDHLFWQTICEYGVQGHSSVVMASSLVSNMELYKVRTTSLPRILISLFDAMCAETSSRQRKHITAQAQGHIDKSKNLMSNIVLPGVSEAHKASVVTEALRRRAINVYRVVAAIVASIWEMDASLNQKNGKSNSILSKIIGVLANEIQDGEEYDYGSKMLSEAILRAPTIRVAVLGTKKSGKTSLVGSMIMQSQAVINYERNRILQVSTINNKANAQLFDKGKKIRKVPKKNSQDRIVESTNELQNYSMSWPFGVSSEYELSFAKEAVSNFDHLARYSLLEKSKDNKPLIPSLLYGKQAYIPLLYSTVWIPQAHYTLSSLESKLTTFSSQKYYNDFSNVVAALQSEVALITHPSGRTITDDSEDYSKVVSGLKLHKVLGTSCVVIAVTKLDKQDYSRQAFLNTRASFVSSCLRETGYGSDAVRGPMSISSNANTGLRHEVAGNVSLAPSQADSVRFDPYISGQAIFVPSSVQDLVNIVTPAVRSYIPLVDKVVRYISENCGKMKLQDLITKVSDLLPFPLPAFISSSEGERKLSEWYKGPSLGEVLDTMRLPPLHSSFWRCNLASRQNPLMLVITYVEPQFDTTGEGKIDEETPHYCIRAKILQGTISLSSFKNANGLTQSMKLGVLPPISSTTFSRCTQPFTILISNPRDMDQQMDAKRFNWNNHTDEKGPMDSHSEHVTACTLEMSAANSYPKYNRTVNGSAFNDLSRSSDNVTHFVSGDYLYLDVRIPQLPTAIVDFINQATSGSVPAPSVDLNSSIPPFSLHAGDVVISPIPVSKPSKDSQEVALNNNSILSPYDNPAWPSRLPCDIPFVLSKKASIIANVLKDPTTHLRKRVLPRKNRLISLAHASSSDTDFTNPIQGLLFGECDLRSILLPFTHFVFRYSESTPLHPLDSILFSEGMRNASPLEFMNGLVKFIRSRSSAFDVTDLKAFDLRSMKVQELSDVQTQQLVKNELLHQESEWTKNNVSELMKDPLYCCISFNSDNSKSNLCYPWLYPCPEFTIPGPGGCKSLTSFLWVDDSALDEVLSIVDHSHFEQYSEEVLQAKFMELLMTCIFAVGRVVHADPA